MQWIRRISRTTAHRRFTYGDKEVRRDRTTVSRGDEGRPPTIAR
jgi:hypothetical protein